MKVLQVNKFNYLHGGADKYFLDLSKMLEQNGVEIARFCMKHPDNLPSKDEKYFVSKINLRQPNLHDLFKLVPRMIYSLEAKHKFAKLVKDFQPDIIHLHNIYHQISPSILTVAKQNNIPVVMHVHDYKLICPNYKMFSGNKICEQCRGGKYYKCFLKRCFKKSFIKSFLVMIEMYLHHKVLNIYDKNINLYLAPSRFVKDKLVEWGIDEQKIQVLPHYIDTEKFKPNYELGDYLLYFGRLSQEKGISKLVEAMAGINDIKLKIVGAGSEYKQIQKQVKDLNLISRVEIVGPKHDDELKEIIRKAYAVVVPSQWYEIFGLVNLEAAALGKLVIASQIGGIPETVKDQVTALLFKANSVEDLRKKINWALDNPDKTKQMAQSARQFVEQEFKPARHLEAILSVYNRYLR